MYYDSKKLVLSIFWVLVGAALIALSVMEVLNSSMYAGLGGGLFAVGLLQIARNIKYRKDPTYREKIDTEANDERNRYLRMKSWSWAGYIAILVEGIGAIVAMVAGEQTIQLVLSYSVCLLLAVYLISYIILSRKY